MATGRKTGGRKVGTPNKLNFELRTMLSAALAEELEALPQLLAELTPPERIDALVKLAKFCLPTIAPLDSSKQIELDHDPTRTAQKIQARADFDNVLDGF